ncbi:MAG: hypothetical protein GX443_17200 [Deltaproteobacteria bacterium]|nr:hypothetical protein [Deltaproteobacteria bacterium]
MTMWCFDEWDEMDEFRLARESILALEREHREIASILGETRQALRGDPENPELRAREKYYGKRLADLEKSRLLASEVPIELALWGPPHG